MVPIDNLLGLKLILLLFQTLLQTNTHYNYYTPTRWCEMKMFDYLRFSYIEKKRLFGRWLFVPNKYRKRRINS